MSLTDEEARGAIMEVLGNLEIPQVKSLSGRERNVVLKRVKEIKG
ncbi:hypothetical protein N783_11215 [Pontibacillus marinus BH030004 = DSM 16465]|uniref:Uncharacterized protein n=1 Tax=Pontibacillus marinus BH030004 = DSM 16465 TaxID=1385511 RepID=A0A0A5GGX7_9BACI|nr:hypothetical protein N783_11215 [Pontibacillus marinus BH030004 = DSM 16465]